MTTDREIGLLRLLRAMSAYLEDARDDDSVLRLFLRSAREFFSATESCLAVRHAGAGDVQLLHQAPADSDWDREMLAAFLRGERPRIPFDMLAAPLRRRGRGWGAIFLRRHGLPFHRGEGWDLVEVAGHVTRLLDQLDRRRIREVRARVDRKIME